ncbi:hypothetical protein [Mesorhizobium sp. M0208]|uniref:hypothetical protein n=1 Tax=Mesorhizobium sp. M0208 TaxID=2956916 RepID=UPI003334D152
MSGPLVPVSREFDVSKFRDVGSSVLRGIWTGARLACSRNGCHGTGLVEGWWREAKEAGRNYLARQQGDAVLAAAGYNFSLLLR